MPVLTLRHFLEMCDQYCEHNQDVEPEQMWTYLLEIHRRDLALKLPLSSDPRHNGGGMEGLNHFYQWLRRNW